MICVVIKGPSYEQVKEQILRALETADLIEMRLDLFAAFSLSDIMDLKNICSIPMILSLRSCAQGGGYQGSEESRLLLLSQLANLHPEYLDLEYNIDREFYRSITLKYPDIKIILSYHNFKETPCDLDSIYNEMKELPASYYKMAVQAQNSIEALRLVLFSKDKPSLIGVSMGKHGILSRILSKTITYASLSDELQTAEGQLTAQTLKTLYRYDSIDANTLLFGLIGAPIEQSIGHTTHNSIFQKAGINAVYVKMEVEEALLKSFINLAKQLPFKGLSVTMPLKESVLKQIDFVDPEALAIQAVNTLYFEDSKILGYNTDSTGALDALEVFGKVKDKRMIILGAGGAAKAIAYEAFKRGANLVILNRDIEKAKLLASKFKNSQALSIDEMNLCAIKGYDILVNCTPLSMPIGEKFLMPNAIVMDINISPKAPSLINAAALIGCVVIPGYEMFIRQATLQYHLWFDHCYRQKFSRSSVVQ